MNRQSLNSIFNFIFVIATVLIIIASFSIMKTLNFRVFGKEHEALVIRNWDEIVKSNYHDGSYSGSSFIKHVEFVIYKDIEKTNYKDSVLIFDEKKLATQNLNALERIDLMCERIRKSSKPIKLPSSIKRYYMHNVSETVSKQLLIGNIFTAMIKGDGAMVKNKEIVTKQNRILLFSGLFLILMSVFIKTFLNYKRKNAIKPA